MTGYSTQGRKAFSASLEVVCGSGYTDPVGKFTAVSVNIPVLLSSRADRNRKVIQLRRKNKTAFALLCSAMLLSAMPSAVQAEGEAEVTIGGVSVTAPEFFGRYGVLGADQYKSILNGYEIYLSADPAFQSEADALWAAGSSYGSVQNHAAAAIGVFNETNTDRSAALDLSGYVSLLQSMGGSLPAVQIPEESSRPEQPNEPSVDPTPAPPSEEVTEPSRPSTPEEGNKPSENPEKPSEPGQKPTDNPDEPEKPTDGNQKPDSGSSNNPNRTPGTSPEKNPDKPTISLSSPHAYEGSVKTLSKTSNRKIEIEGVGTINLLPDFSNGRAWKNSTSAYNTPFLWGQCTWFAWGRFYEIYKFDPGFTGNGYACVGQLLNAHPDKFELSRTPAAGAVFSSDTAHNHVGIVLEYDAKTEMLTIQEGNLDIVSNPIWAEAIEDWRTVTVTASDMRAMYGDVTYAVPKAGKLNAAQKAEARRKATMSLRSLALEKFKAAFKDEPVKPASETKKSSSSSK